MSRWANARPQSALPDIFKWKVCLTQKTDSKVLRFIRKLRQSITVQQQRTTLPISVQASRDIKSPTVNYGLSTKFYLLILSPHRSRILAGGSASGSERKTFF